MSLISLLVFFILIGLAFWAVRALSAAFGLPQPIVTVVYVVLVIIAVVYLLQAFGLMGGGPVIRVN